MAVKHGAKAKIDFCGKHVEDVPPVEVTMPADSAGAPGRPEGAGASGWPVPVTPRTSRNWSSRSRTTSRPRPTGCRVPCGITARFLDKGDVDHFVFAAKKGAKYAIVAETYDILSPAEVYLIVKDAKGAELAKSNPANYAGPDRLHCPGGRRLLHLCGAPELRFRADRGVSPVGPRGLPDFDVQLHSIASPWRPAKRR